MPEKNYSRKIPLFHAILLPFIITIVLSVGLVSYIAFSNGHKAVNAVSDQLKNEITEHIKEHLADFLEIPHNITHTAAMTISQGFIDPTDSESLLRYFYEQVKLYTSISSIYFGNISGGLFDSGREIKDDSKYIIITEQLKKGPLLKYALDADGNQTDLISRVPDFDATKRPWYTAAVEKGSSAWSPVYILSTGQDMAIAASRPVYDKDKRLLGVVSVDIFLSHINQFLANLKIGKTGQAFIIERSGLLIASSGKESLIQKKTGKAPLSRLDATASTSPLIQQSMGFLNTHTDLIKTIEADKILEYKTNGKRRYLQISPMKNRYDLDWLVVVVMPETDFMERIDTSKRHAAFLIGTIIAVVLMAGYRTIRNITNPIQKLNEAAEILAAGNTVQSIHNRTRLYELNALTDIFNQMSRKLQKAIAKLKKENSQRKLTQEALTKSEEKYRLVVENAGEAITIGQNGRFVFFNPKFEELIGYSHEEIAFHPYTVFIHPDDRNMVYERYMKRMQGENIISVYPFRMIKKSGKTLWIELKAVRIEWEGKPASLSFISDISEQKSAMEKIRSALKEKESMLKEIHHRVKNNMQIISSLLNLQSSRAENLQMRDSYAEAQSRIQSIAVVHETLYQSKDLAFVEIQKYLEGLTRDISQLFSHSAPQMKISIHAGNIKIGIEKAVPFGIIVNELILNAFKHAFPSSAEGRLEISIELETEKTVKMTVSDDGTGLPVNFNPLTSETLGLPLVLSIVEEQLEGEWEIDGIDGVRWIIRWPLV